MTSEATVRETLEKTGFEEQKKRAAYQPTTRFTHPEVPASSLFVGEGPEVTYIKTTRLRSTGPFLIANGRSFPRRMTQRLLSLGVPPTGRIRDPDGRPPVDDDPFWQGKDLDKLLNTMAKQWPPKSSKGAK